MPTIEELQAENETLKGQLAERDAAFAPLKAELEELKTTRVIASATNAQLEEAITQLKAVLSQGNPDLPAEMISGATPAEVLASLSTARALVEKVKANLAEQAKAAPIPVGAPGRLAPSTEGMTGVEKIKMALQAKK